VYLWKQKEVNLISMASYTLGNAGKGAAWILYIFLFYSLMVAYIAGGGQIVNDLLELFPFLPKLPFLGSLIFIAALSPFVYIGAKAVDRINLFLMIGLFVSFFLFVFFGVNHIEAPKLFHKNFPLAIGATPIVFASFAFQGIVPTLTTYLQRDRTKVRLAIILGISIPFLIYALWEGLILGIIPLEELKLAQVAGLSAVHPLKKILDFPWLFRIGEFFAFFALVTSFLGVALGLLDFLADGLKVKKTFKGRFLLCSIIFLPPFLFTLINPTLFLTALEYAGGIGCALLLGLLPILMTWWGRYIHKFPGQRLLLGGKISLIALSLFIFFELYVMFAKFL
jgi:tyrosine-specific transport protein